MNYVFLGKRAAKTAEKQGAPQNDPYPAVLLAAYS